MEITAAKQSSASRAFELRKKVRDFLLSAQTSEYNYYKKLGGQVESTATYLCDVFSKIIQHEMLSWSETKLQLFATSSRIPLVVLQEWRSASVKMNDTEKMVLESEELVKHLKSEKLKFSATLWGGKKGLEVQYDAANVSLNHADSSHKITLEEAQLACATATKSAGIVLEQCISHAVEIAQCPIFGTGIKAFLSKVAQTASQSQILYNHEQMRLIDEMQFSLDALRIIYRS